MSFLTKPDSSDGRNLADADILHMRPKTFLLLLFFHGALLAADPLYSPTWGFRLDMPPGYEYSGGNAFDRFSFEGPSNSMFDMIVYSGTYTGMEEMVADVNSRMANGGDATYFEYAGRAAVMLELNFNGLEGWALGLELENSEDGQSPPLLLALAYAPAGTENVDLLHVSALNSIEPTQAEAFYPGPVMEFAFPRGGPVEVPLAGLNITAMIRENDAEAAQNLVDNEFLVLRLYENSEFWQEAWIRFFRAINRDSWDRISDAAFRIERKLRTGADDRAFAQNVLSFVQAFSYERDLDGSDFVNLVSAVTEGRGDCDSRAMLWSVILSQANIRSAIMVSRNYSHAMGLVDLPGDGARFSAGGTDWLVAETTATVDIGRIAQDISNTRNWLGVLFDD